MLLLLRRIHTLLVIQSIALKKSIKPFLDALNTERDISEGQISFIKHSNKLCLLLNGLRRRPNSLWQSLNVKNNSLRLKDDIMT